MFAVGAAAMEGSKCTAMGEGLSKARAGLPAVLQIKAADRFGNRRSTGMLTLCDTRDQVLPRAAS